MDVTTATLHRQQRVAPKERSTYLRFLRLGNILRSKKQTERLSQSCELGRMELPEDSVQDANGEEIDRYIYYELNSSTHFP